MKLAACLSLVLLPCLALAQVVVPPSSPRAGELQQEAAAGDANAQLALARAYQKGEGVPQNDELAVKWFRAAAEQGNAAAQNDLGVMYRMGTGVERNYEQARQWYMKAAQQKYPAALFNLGTVYYNGNGVSVSDERAYAYFTLAREAGSAEGAQAVQRMTAELSPVKLRFAQLFLAELLERELGDPQRALPVYEKLAQEGDDTAPIRAAKIYLDGKGVARDVGHARDLCALAAGKNLTPGMVCLGYLYQAGELGSPDFASALKWYEKAATKGNPMAMYSLGVMYAKGTGVKQDNAKAYAWFAKAARGQVSTAGPALAATGARLSKGKIAQITQEARQAFVLSVNMYPELLEFNRALKLD